MALTDEQIANKVFLGARDVAEAGDYLWSLRELSRNRENLDEYRLRKAQDAILIAAIVVYARPFTTSFSNGEAAKKLSPDNLALFDGLEDLQSLHEKVISLRNQAVAHADWSFHPTALVPSDDVLGFYREFSRLNYMELIDHNDFAELIKHAFKVISDSAYFRDSSLARNFSSRD